MAWRISRRLIEQASKAKVAERFNALTSRIFSLEKRCGDLEVRNEIRKAAIGELTGRLETLAGQLEGQYLNTDTRVLKDRIACGMRGHNLTLAQRAGESYRFACTVCETSYWRHDNAMNAREQALVEAVEGPQVDLRA